MVYTLKFKAVDPLNDAILECVSDDLPDGVVAGPGRLAEYDNIVKDELSRLQLWLQEGDEIQVRFDTIKNTTTVLRAHGNT